MGVPESVSASFLEDPHTPVADVLHDVSVGVINVGEHHYTYQAGKRRARVSSVSVQLPKTARYLTRKKPNHDSKTEGKACC